MNDSISSWNATDSWAVTVAFCVWLKVRGFLAPAYLQGSFVMFRCIYGELVSTFTASVELKESVRKAYKM